MIPLCRRFIMIELRDWALCHSGGDACEKVWLSYQEAWLCIVLYVTCASVVGAGTTSVSTQGKKKINNGGGIEKKLIVENTCYQVTTWQYIHRRIYIHTLFAKPCIDRARWLVKKDIWCLSKINNVFVGDQLWVEIKILQLKVQSITKKFSLYYW